MMRMRRIKIAAITFSFATCMSMMPCMSVSAQEEDEEISTSSTAMVYTPSTYNAHEVIDSTFMDGNTFKYSDGYFEEDPKQYDPHMATTSADMAYASQTFIHGNDYSHGAIYIEDLLSIMGYRDMAVNSGYVNEPTDDSIGCIVAAKDVDTQNGIKKVISVTIRSANYGAEWVSNVTIGKSGEAEGFSGAADQVMKFLNDYIAKRPELQAVVKNGEAAFWLQGYSRGGATANLTAKRIIDQYANDKVYAYCLEAPQGGVAAAELSGRDYSSIHNVINVDDLVPRVAPTGMGFKRYGVDHYLSVAAADSDNPQQSLTFKNNLSDNLGYAEATDGRVQAVKDQIDKMCDENGLNPSDYYPYFVTGKRLALSPKDHGIDDDKTFIGTTEDVIADEITSLLTTTDRNGYVDSGLQDAVRRLMQYQNSDGDIAGLIKDIDFSSLLKSVLGSCWSELSKETTVDDPEHSGTLTETVKWVIGSDDLAYTLNLSDETVDKVCDVVADYIRNNQALSTKLQNYPGGTEAAIDDVKLIAGKVLRSVSDADSFVTFLSNIDGIFRNHSMVQVIGWLRSYDSWYSNCPDNDFLG